MPKFDLDINRPLTGFLSLLLLGGGFFCYSLSLGDEMMQAGLIRTGLVLGALWLALPTKNRPAAWENVSGTSILIGIIAVLVFLIPRLRWAVLPLAVVVGVLYFFLSRPIRRR